MPLPHLGIVEPVRVCETCYEERNSAKTVKPPSSTHVPTPSQSNRSLQPRSARIEDDDDGDLKMALQMSLEEAQRAGVVTSQPTPPRQEPSRPTRQIYQQTDSGEDEDLKAAIAASLKDMEAKKTMQYPSVQPSQPASEPPVRESPQSQITYSTQQQVQQLKRLSLTSR
jgi:hepatocyte growth factor-regulated tyrosine kinase substrate